MIYSYRTIFLSWNILDLLNNDVIFNCKNESFLSIQIDVDKTKLKMSGLMDQSVSQSPWSVLCSASHVRVSFRHFTFCQ